MYKFSSLCFFVLLSLQLAGQSVPKMHDSVAEHIYTLNDLEYLIDPTNSLQFSEGGTNPCNDRKLSLGITLEIIYAGTRSIRRLDEVRIYLLETCPLKYKQ